MKTFKCKQIHSNTTKKGVNMEKTTVHSNQFIVGSVDKDNRFSLSPTPAIHREYKDAVKEAERLASLFPEKRYVVYAVVAVASRFVPVVLPPVTLTYSL